MKKAPYKTTMKILTENAVRLDEIKDELQFSSKNQAITFLIAYYRKNEAIRNNQLKGGMQQ